MFGLFKKDPVKKIKKAYHDKLEKAMLAQRGGDIRTYSMLTAEAEDLRAEMEKLQAAQASK